MSLYVKSLPTREGDTFAPASLSELAKGLADAIQCPNCEGHGYLISTDYKCQQVAARHPCDECACPVCRGSGRLDGKALQAARSQFSIWIEGESDVTEMIRDMCHAYLEALQEDTE